MEISMQVIVTAAKRYDFDGNKGAQVYTLGDMIEKDDRIGCPVMKLTAENGPLSTPVKPWQVEKPFLVDQIRPA
jgi:restriction endonuclease Mrr